MQDRGCGGRLGEAFADIVFAFLYQRISLRVPSGRYVFSVGGATDDCLDAKELAKFVILLLLFGGIVPAAAMALRGKDRAQAWIMAIIIFTTIGGLLRPAEYGLTLGSVEWYRGHAKGYHFYLNEALSLMLCLAIWREAPRTFRWFPPGLKLWFLYCGLSLLSIINAPMPNYTCMAAVRFFTAGIYYIAAYNFVRHERQLLFLIRALAATLTWEFLAVLKGKYIDGMYQVRGTFEHQNPLAMYATMAGVLFLAVGMGPQIPRGNLLLGAFLATAAIVQSTLSRGGLMVFALGTVAVVLLSLVDKPTKRRLTCVAVLGAVGTLGLVMAIGTIIARFNDEGNEASGETRHLMNAAAVAMVQAHPLGIGWNNYAHTINPPFPYGDIIDDAERERGHKVDPDYAKGVVESHYYLLLSETGWQGLLSYLAFIGLMLWWNLRAMLRFRHHLLGCVSLGIAVGCGCNYLQSTLERVLTQPRNLMLWMLLLGVASRIESWRRNPPTTLSLGALPSSAKGSA